jgi:hypothetical protein
MRVQQPVRDRNMSLWQSAVRPTLINRGDIPDDDKKTAEYGTSLHAQAAQAGDKAPPAPIPQPQAAGAPQMGPPANVAHASKAAFDALQAHQNSDSSMLTGLFTSLHDLVTKYSSWDVAGWVQCGWYYMKYYVISHLPPSYNDWQGTLRPTSISA